MLKAVKVKLYPSYEQEILFNKLFGCSRKVYNLSLTYKQEQYELDNSKPIGLKELGKHFHNELLKDPEYHYLLEHNTKVLKQSIIDLLAAYKNYFESLLGKRKGEKVGLPTFKCRFDKQTARFPAEAVSKKPFNDNMDRLNLTSSFKNLKFACSGADRKYLEKHKDSIKSVTVTKSKAGTFTASILIDGDKINNFRKNSYKKYENPDKAIGLDLGIKSYYVSYDGENSEEQFNPKFIRTAEKKLKRLQRKLSKLDKKNRDKRNEQFLSENGKPISKKEGNKIVVTNNRNKLKKRLAKQYEKITNKRDTFLHELTSKIVNENQVIVLEDLNVKGMMKNRKLSKAVGELCLGRFREFLKYKCEWYDRELIVINRFYPSSKLCSCCGHKKEDLKLSDRTYVCSECGHTIDRDLNAAINIRQEGLRLKAEKEIGNRFPELKLED